MNDVKNNVRTETLPRTWSDIIGTIKVGEVRKFPCINPQALQSARVAISRWIKKHPEADFATESSDGFFTITRNEDKSIN